MAKLESNWVSDLFKEKLRVWPIVFVHSLKYSLPYGAFFDAGGVKKIYDVVVTGAEALKLDRPEYLIQLINT